MRRLSTLTLFWPLSRQEYGLLSPSSLSFLLNFIQDPPCGIIIIKKARVIVPRYPRLSNSRTSRNFDRRRRLQSSEPVFVRLCLVCESRVWAAGTPTSYCKHDLILVHQKGQKLHPSPQKIRFFFFKPTASIWRSTATPLLGGAEDGHFPKVMASNPLKAAVLWPRPRGASSMCYVIL